MSGQRTAPGRRDFLRDALSYLGGWGLILKQAGIFFPPPESVSIPLVITGGLLVGVPGLAQLVMWWLQVQAGTPGISGPPSGPVDPPPPPS